MVLHVHKRFTRAKAKFIFRIIVLRKFQTQLRKRWERGSLMGNLRADHRIISLLFLWCRRSPVTRLEKLNLICISLKWLHTWHLVYRWTNQIRSVISGSGANVWLGPLGVWSVEGTTYSGRITTVWAFFDDFRKHFGKYFCSSLSTMIT